MYNIFIIMMILLGAYALFSILYVKFRGGQLIIKINDDKSATIFSVVMFIIFVVAMIIFQFKDYTFYKSLSRDHALYSKLPSEHEYVKSLILSCAFWTEVMAIVAFDAMKHPEIREKGIYYFYRFYKWESIKNWKWIEENTVQFKIALFYKLNYRIKMHVSKYSKWSMDEILRKYIKNGTDKN